MPYAIDVINHCNGIRDMFTYTEFNYGKVTYSLHIAEDIGCNGSHKARNIFDELAAKVEKDLGK